MRILLRCLSLGGLCALAPVALAAEPQRTFVLTGQVFVYPENVSELGRELRFAPAGVTRNQDRVLHVETPAAVVIERGQIASLASGQIAPASPSLMLTRGDDSPLDAGVPELHVEDGVWTLYGTSEDMYARPLLTVAPESLSVRQLSNYEYAISGELVVHEALAEAFHVAHLAGRPAGSLTLVARGYRSNSPAIPIDSIRIAPPAGPQPPPSQMNLVGSGPDVIVSTVGGTLTKNGTVGAISAYSMTTVSCNIGTGDAVWIDCNQQAGAGCNQHPVIGQQIYRLKPVNGAKQFEQIGMSWLKHGWCAADAQNATSCPGSYQPDPSCDWLGLFATDTYGAGLNGDQQDLGPRSEIQPFTGVYPWLPTAWNVTGNAIYKRTQVANADLLPASNVGAQYFGEVVYITTDEPDYHRYNNASWRPITSGGADGTSLSFTGSTAQQQSAMQAWALNDAGVLLTNVDVPGDGRFVLGSKATDLGGGTWHYEYVLHNMNVHDSAYSLSIPAAGVVNPRNVGFHDVPYHSGEPYDGTDWSSVLSSTSVSWNTDTFGANPNANAVRWSTSYSFRFDADSPPANGLATIGLFRSGGSIQGAIVVPQDPGAPYCFGDGSGLACPCGNSGAAGNGCANSVVATGSNLTVAGVASVSADTLALQGSGMPNGSALYYQGTATSGGGFGQAFGDGLRCAAGAVRRFKVQLNVGFASQYPGVGDAPIHIAGAITGPATHYYQCWYRNANPTFCTPDVFNLSNGYRVVWLP